MFDGVLTSTEEGLLLLGAFVVSMGVLLVAVLALRKEVRLLLESLRR